MAEALIPNRQSVVIVDDRATNLKILERLAQSLDEVEVRLFAHPQRALEDAAGSPPDLVLTDFNMPELDGAAFIRRFRGIAGCADIPVIVVTAYEDRDLRYRALEAGATDFLLSPVDHHEFRVRLRNLLTLRRQQLLLRARASSLEEQLVADARRHRDALRESHELLLRVIDTVPLAVVATDRDDRYVFVNDWFARSVGKNPALIIGQTPAAVLAAGSAREAMERDRRLMGGLEADGSFEQVVTRPDGARSVVLSSKAVLRDAAGRAMLVVTAALDITARKEAELALIAAKEEAELASRSKSEFLANMSHELRTPLNAIIGFSQVMAEEVMGPLGNARYAGYARDICASAQHLLGIISDILDVSKLEAGKVELDEAAVSLPHVVHDVLQLVAERAQAIDIAIATDVAPDLPALRADGLKLKQVLLNLVTNAIKFSPAGGRVELAARYGAAGFEITVSDHGIGMDAAELQTAVTRFGQVASTWSRRHAGTGLGLPLAIGLVELHGGRLAIESRKDVGTTVRVHLPAARALAAKAAVGA